MEKNEHGILISTPSWFWNEIVEMVKWITAGSEKYPESEKETEPEEEEENDCLLWCCETLAYGSLYRRGPFAMVMSVHPILNYQRVHVNEGDVPLQDRVITKDLAIDPKTSKANDTKEQFQIV